MLTRSRRRLCADYLSVLRSLVEAQNIRRRRHGWGKSRWIVWIYFTLCLHPEQTLNKLCAFSRGSETRDNFMGFYAPIVTISRLEFFVAVISRLAVPVYLLFFYTPHLHSSDYSKIIFASTLWCLLVYVIEHEVYMATEESDIFQLVAKFDRRYNPSRR